MRKETSTNLENQVALSSNCPIITIFDELGGRWKIKLLYMLKAESKRYSQLKKDVPMISEKMLTTQLKELVEDGWVIKTDYKTIPPHTEYCLSEKGQSFVPILDQIYDWALANSYTLTLFSN